MLIKRIIPMLLLQGGGLLKGEKFKKHRYVGDPVNAVRIFNEKEVDELCLIDIGVTANRSEPDYAHLEEIVSEAFMPIAYGGGVCKISQVEKLFKIGVEKVIINTAFFENPSFVSECSAVAGAQSIVVSIDYRKGIFGRHEVFVHNGSRKTGRHPVEYALEAQEYGAGELLLTSIEREGGGKGCDLELIEDVVSTVGIPVVAHGGVGELQHIRQAITQAGASAVAAGSFFTFYGKHKAVLLTYPDQCELHNLFNARKI